MKSLSLWGAAVVLGNGCSRPRPKVPFRPPGVISMGCNALYRDFSPDFLGVSDLGMLMEILRAGYARDHVVVASSRVQPQVEEWLAAHSQEHLYLWDHDPSWSTGPMMVHVAALAGCNPIHLVGWDGADSAGFVSNHYVGSPNYPVETLRFSTETWDAQLKRVACEFPHVSIVKSSIFGDELVFA